MKTDRSETINHSFARFALPITWGFRGGERRHGDRAGSYFLCVDRVATGVDTLERWALKSKGMTINRASAMAIEGEFDAIVTDPPYYDSIPYSDIMDFFYVWLRRCLYGMSPEMDAAFAGLLGPKWDHEAGDGELIDDSSRFGGDKAASKKNFEDGMAAVFRRFHAALKPSGILVIVYLPTRTPTRGRPWWACSDSRGLRGGRKSPDPNRAVVAHAGNLFGRAFLFGLAGLP